MVTYYNPHIDDFLAEPLQFRLLKRRALKKYGFMFDEMCKNGTSIRVLIDGTASGLIPEKLFHRLPAWFRMTLANLEFWLWKCLNGFDTEIERVPLPKQPVDEILLGFSYKAATGRFALREGALGHYRAVIFHLSHYFLDTAEKAANIKKLPNAFLAGDSDITSNEYFQQYFNWYKKPFLVMPFAVGPRFINQRSWLTRDAKAVATGSFHDLRLEQPARKYIDFMKTTGQTTYHPVRLAIYEAVEQLSAWVTCKISPYRQYRENHLSRLFSHFRVSQKKYFSINIVDLYNQHRYAIIGEELSGFPALGAFEAMACGCVLIAQPKYYEGLGLLPNQHYLAYEGNVDSIIQILNQGKATTLERLATDTSDFIKKQFSPGAVYAKWMIQFKSLADE